MTDEQQKLQDLPPCSMSMSSTEVSCSHKQKGGNIRPLFYTFIFLFYGRGGGDGCHHQGYPAPPSLVTSV